MATTLTRRVARKSASARPRNLVRDTRRKLFLEALEDRRLLAGLEGWTPEMLLDRLDIREAVYGPQPLPTPIDTASIATAWALPSSLQTLPVRRELVVVDGGVQDYQQLLNDLGRGSAARSLEIEAILIDTSVDGIEALTKVLENVRDLDAIHIVSHGGAGMLKLGNVTLTAENLDQYSAQIQAWRDSLRDGADLLLYGCDLAGNEAGRQFIGSLQELTGADVAASDDTTGDVARGNNWDLEYETGPVDTETAFSELLQQNWNGTLETRTFPAGSYVVVMGVYPQTIGNALKPYGLLYDLVTNHGIPVAWTIDSTKDDFRFSTTGAVDYVDFTAMKDTDNVPGGASVSKDYSGGPFVISGYFMTPAILTTINNWRAQGVVVDLIADSFTAEVYGDVTSFPRAVLDQQNGSIVTGYYANAGVPATSYVLGSPPNLNSCYDLYVIPHADPQSWDPSWRAALVNFIDNNQGGLWGACHSVSAYENDLITDQDMHFLSTGLLEWGDHDAGTLPYSYNPDAANDPIMQIMDNLDLATTNGSEQIYIPTATTAWRPTTTVAVYDPDHPDHEGTTLAEQAALVAYGYAYGDPTNGFIMYEAGHSHAKSSGAANIAAQRAYFNFIAFQGILHAPQIDVTLPSIVAGQTATLSTTITGGSGTYSYQWISTNGSTFSNPVGTVFEGEPIETEFLLTVPNDTIKLLVQDSCGRRSVYGAGVSDTPPVLGENFTGCFQADGVLVPAVGPVSISDAGTTLASAAVRLTNRPDGAAETLVINQSLAASHGITIESDGNGGFNLSGTATHAQYDAVLESLQYVNSLANPTLVNRTITVTVNDGASDSNFLTSTLQPPTMGSFTGTPGGSPVTSYYENGILYLSVNDQTGNTTGGPDTISVSLQSTTETETLTLTETGNSTGVFTGQIQSSTTAGIGDDDILNAPVGTSVTGSHVSVAGCGVWNGSVSIVTPTYEYKPLYFTPDLAMDRVDPVGTNDTTTATQAMIPSPGGEDLTGMAVWSGAGGGTLEYQQWQGETFGPLSTTTTGATDRYRTMAAASAPTRNEHIVIGVGLDNDVDAMLWNGTAWSQISISGNTDLGTVTNDAYWGAEVAYEQTSGNPMLVWTDGTALKYAKGTWNGSSYTWSAATTISTLAATPTQLRLAADPTSNEMILAVNYANEIDTAIVWDGTTWGNEQILDANTGHDRTDIYVAYEQQSGDALVVYATGTTGNLAYTPGTGHGMAPPRSLRRRPRTWTATLSGRCWRPTRTATASCWAW